MASQLLIPFDVFKQPSQKTSNRSTREKFNHNIGYKYARSDPAAQIRHQEDARMFDALGWDVGYTTGFDIGEKSMREVNNISNYADNPSDQYLAPDNDYGLIDSTALPSARYFATAEPNDPSLQIQNTNHSMSQRTGSYLQRINPSVGTLDPKTKRYSLQISGGLDWPQNQYRVGGTNLPTEHQEYNTMKHMPKSMMEAGAPGRTTSKRPQLDARKMANEFAKLTSENLVYSKNEDPTFLDQNPGYGHNLGPPLLYEMYEDPTYRRNHPGDFRKPIPLQPGQKSNYYYTQSIQKPFVREDFSDLPLPDPANYDVDTVPFEQNFGEDAIIENQYDDIDEFFDEPFPESSDMAYKKLPPIPNSVMQQKKEAALKRNFETDYYKNYLAMTHGRDEQTGDSRMAMRSINNGRKAQNSVVARSTMTRNNFQKYFQSEIIESANSRGEQFRDDNTLTTDYESALAQGKLPLDSMKFARDYQM